MEATNETIYPFHLLQTIACLRLEVRTGLRHSRGSVLKMAKQVYGVTGGKVEALRQLEALRDEVMPA